MKYSKVNKKKVKEFINFLKDKEVIDYLNLNEIKKILMKKLAKI